MDFQRLYELSKNSPLIQALSRFHLLIISCLIVLVGVVVHATGGVKYVYSHSMYLPIIYGAAVYGLRGGLLVGLVGGVVLGPFMPIDTSTGEAQKLINWVYRTGFFCVIGGIAGFAFESLKRQIQHLRWVSFHDASSGLPNHNELCREIDLLAQSHSGPFALALCSIGNYSQIANTFGVEVSDLLLPQIFSRLKRFPQVSSVCSLQKDRFGFLMTDLDSPGAARLAEEVLDALAPSFDIEGVPLYFDVCAGLAHSTHNGGSGTLLQKANIAMYHAQENGRRLVFYDEAIKTVPKETLELLGEIPVALHGNEFQLYYQPKIDLRTRRVFGLEALIRWQHPTRGMIPPYKFISQAENTGLIKPITRWVIATGLVQLAQWRQEGLDISLALNISARNLSDEALCTTLKQQLEQYRIPPDKVELEVTESAIMTDFEQARNRLAELKGMGLRLAIDDFGTGQSSLAYLKLLPVDSLKIDLSFVKNMSKSVSDRKIIKATIDLAHTFKMQSVAEGVEDEETLALLAEMGCEAAQGYHFCQPMPAIEVSAWLAQWQRVKASAPKERAILPARQQ